MLRPHDRARLRAAAFAAALLFFPAFTAFAEGNLLGKIDFPNSGSLEAQADFIEGVLYLHNFEYDEANVAFVRAQKIDPEFAMAYWGEAMTYNHSLWNRQSRNEALEGLRRLGRTPEDRVAKAPTQREKDYLGAIEILFGNTDESNTKTKHERDVLYRDTMRRMNEIYPDDHEAAAFYGLSILGAGYGKRDFAVYMKAAAELTEVWDANRMHPGAAHYLIHSYDDPIHAPLGLPMARVYSEIAPAAAHAQHMTSHIFVALGMWDDLVAGNERAVEIELKNLSDDEERPRTAAHYVHWLNYGYLQQGRVAEARAVMKAARDRIKNNPTPRELNYYGTMFARYMIDSGAWDSQAEWTAPEGIEMVTPNYHFALALGSIEGGDIDAARERMRYVVAVENESNESVASEKLVEVLLLELEALFALAAGESENSVALAREAVSTETGMSYSFGPPRAVKPSAELLGDILLDLDRGEEAAAAYEDQLTRTPRRTNTLLGLARAAKQQGDDAKAAEAYRQLADVWHDADADLLAFTEAVAHGEDENNF